MQLFYRLAADAVVVHMAYALTIVVGQLCIMIGAWRNWRWVRRWDFRIVHTVMIVIVVLESWLGIVCPLTTWEKQLRKAAGETSYDGDFIANLIHDALFFDLPTWAFTLIYSAFGLLVVTSWWWCKPQRIARVSEEARSESESV